jgi:hypothetical protein
MPRREKCNIKEPVAQEIDRLPAHLLNTGTNSTLISTRGPAQSIEKGNHPVTPRNNQKPSEVLPLLLSEQKYPKISLKRLTRRPKYWNLLKRQRKAPVNRKKLKVKLFWLMARLKDQSSSLALKIIEERLPRSTTHLNIMILNILIPETADLLIHINVTTMHQVQAVRTEMRENHI